MDHVQRLLATPWPDGLVSVEEFTELLVAPEKAAYPLVTASDEAWIIVRWLVQYLLHFVSRCCFTDLRCTLPPPASLRIRFSRFATGYCGCL
jgi:hypothetical protein